MSKDAGLRESDTEGLRGETGMGQMHGGKDGDLGERDRDDRDVEGKTETWGGGMRRRQRFRETGRQKGH